MSTTGTALRVLKFIQKRVRGGLPPTVREISIHMGFASTNGARHWLSKLEAQGKITRQPIVSRGIKLVEPS